MLPAPSTWLGLVGSVTALGYLVLAGLSLRHSERRALVWALAGACLVTAVWSVDAALTPAPHLAAGDSRALGLARISPTSVP